MASVKLVNVTKRYGNLEAIKKINLDIKDGELMVLLGPTGAGKTTTLRSVAGLEHPEEGEIYIGDEKVNGLSPADRDVAFVFQNYSLYPRYTVFENMASPLKARGMDKDRIEKIVKRTADMLHIAHLLQRKPEHLSGGEMQRVALGRALVREPRVFLMDEPLTNLDAKLREEMRGELKRLKSDIGATFFYATPDQAEALSMADRIAVLKNGKIQQVDTPLNIYNHPSNMFIADFLGSPGMNFLPCKIEGRILNIGPGNFKLPLSAKSLRKVEDVSPAEVVFGIRLEDIFISKERQTDWFPAQVDVVELMGSWNIVSLRLGENYIKTRANMDFEAASGDKVWIRLNEKRIHLFDKESERIIF
ncbi:ABC transporter ATP-binding protein [Candidatus Aerophobetes bacterium]|nr:ABC transporter ATP-binding protein [Candidatus Aerophobetes bacterium]